MPAQAHPSATMMDSWSPSQTDFSGSRSSSSSPNNDSNVGDTPHVHANGSPPGDGSARITKTKLNMLRDSSSSSRSKSHHSSRSSSSRRSKPKSRRNYETICHDCGTTDTPLWRVGVNGPGTLCNVCGLLFAKRSQRHIDQFY